MFYSFQNKSFILFIKFIPKYFDYFYAFVKVLVSKFIL